MARYYRLSGKVKPVYFALCALGAVVVALASVAYSIIVYHMPFVYVNFLVTMGIGLLIGGGTAWMTKRGSLRNPFIWVLTLLIYFAIFFYVHMAAYASVVFRETPVIGLEWMPIFLSSPAMLFQDAISTIVEEGVWSLGRSKQVVSGALLLAVWLAEHGIVAWCAVSASKGAILDRPFFEESGSWGREAANVCGWGFLGGNDQRQARQALENEDAEFFRSLPAAEPGKFCCSLSYYADPGEETPETVYLCLKNIQLVQQKKGKVKRTETYVVKNLAAPFRLVERLEEIAREARPAESNAAGAPG